MITSTISPISLILSRFVGNSLTFKDNDYCEFSLAYDWERELILTKLRFSVGRTKERPNEYAAFSAAILNGRISIQEQQDGEDAQIFFEVSKNDVIGSTLYELLAAFNSLERSDGYGHYWVTVDLNELIRRLSNDPK